MEQIEEKEPFRILPLFFRFYLLFISLPVAGTAYVVWLLGVFLGVAAFINFAFQLLYFWNNEVWITQLSLSLFIEIDKSYFSHLEVIFGRRVSEYIYYAYTAKFILAFAMIIILGALITALNYLNLFFARNNIYFVASIVLMAYFYFNILSYALT